jgi:5-(carboxyamino)imidazole ribonucleotide mutase
MKKPQTRRPWRAALASLPSAKPLVGVVMGSNGDWKVMQHAVDVLKDFGVPYETKVVSAHRTPDTLI